MFDSENNPEPAHKEGHLTRGQTKGADMQRLRFIIFFLIILSISIFAPFAYRLAAKQLEVRYSTQPKENELNDWHSHIDNQAYLQQLKSRERTNRYGRSAPLIILDRHRDRRYGDRDYRHRECDSWGVGYRSDTFSFSYQERYRPNQYYPVFIRPRPTPHPLTPPVRHGHPVQRGRRR